MLRKRTLVAGGAVSLLLFTMGAALYWPRPRGWLVEAWEGMFAGAPSRNAQTYFCQVGEDRVVALRIEPEPRTGAYRVVLPGNGSPRSWNGRLMAAQGGVALVSRDQRLVFLDVDSNVESPLDLYAGAHDYFHAQAADFGNFAVAWVPQARPSLRFSRYSRFASGHTESKPNLNLETGLDSHRGWVDAGFRPLLLQGGGHIAMVRVESGSGRLVLRFWRVGRVRLEPLAPTASPGIVYRWGPSEMLQEQSWLGHTYLALFTRAPGPDGVAEQALMSISVEPRGAPVIRTLGPFDGSDSGFGMAISPDSERPAVARLLGIEPAKDTAAGLLIFEEGRIPQWLDGVRPIGGKGNISPSLADLAGRPLLWLEPGANQPVLVLPGKAGGTVLYDVRRPGNSLVLGEGEGVPCAWASRNRGLGPFLVASFSPGAGGARVFAGTWTRDPPVFAELPVVIDETREGAE